MLRLISIIIFFSLFSFSAHSSAPIEWQKLLHYEKKGSTYTSLVENDEYFLTPKGRYSPKDEFDASITTFNQTTDTQKCNFPARFIYLKRKGLVTGSLDNCKEYQQFLQDLQAKSVTMLFTNAYMSNPSSLFGHTLFRIDTNRKGTQLLSHGANFGANTQNDTGVLYALKGIYGKYYGTFTIKPYYDVINLYNNIENRDIWEYELNLDDKELELFLALIWEQKKAKIRYYFFTKNCSYILLSILEATKPELELTNNFHISSAPLSTLKSINNIDGLIKNTNYRPSRQSKLAYRYNQMTNKQKKVFTNIIKNNTINLQDLKDNEKSDILETAYQYIQYQYIKGDLELKTYRKKSFTLLKNRSKIKDNNLYFEDLKIGENPILSHKQYGASLLFGSRNSKTFNEISIKPAYTDLLEQSYGMLNGAEINLLETKLRHYNYNNKFLLNELNLLSIKSLSGADIMFHPISYDIKIQIKELFNPKTNKDTSSFILETGAGQSYKITKNTLLYTLSIPNLGYSGGLSENGYIGFALKGGLYYNNNAFRFHTYAMQNFATSYTSKGQTYSIEASYSLTNNLNLYAKHKYFNTSHNDDKETSIGIKFNF